MRHRHYLPYHLFILYLRRSFHAEFPGGDVLPGKASGRAQFGASDGHWFDVLIAFEKLALRA